MLASEPLPAALSSDPDHLSEPGIVGGSRFGASPVAEDVHASPLQRQAESERTC